MAAAIRLSQQHSCSFIPPRVEAIVAGETRGRKPPAKVRCGRKAEKLKTSEYRANPASGRRARGCDISIGLGVTNGPESQERSNDRRERDRRKITGNHRRGTDPDRDLPEVEEGVSPQPQRCSGP